MTGAGGFTRVCVFCGSSSGASPAFASAARSLGATLVARGMGLVYGGGRVGLMGVVADAVLAAGGEVVGVIPRHLADLEVAHQGLDDLRMVGSMHERKFAMADLADAFIALPGGLGTFEELLEVATWTQLGLHAKPVGVLDVDGFYRPLLDLLDGAATAGFLRPAHRDLLQVGTEPGALLDALAAWTPPTVEKWVDGR